jgi:hypothetical protein
VLSNANDDRRQAISSRKIPVTLHIPHYKMSEITGSTGGKKAGLGITGSLPSGLYVT